MKDFRELQIWQKSMEVFKMVAIDGEKFPRHRVSYCLLDQLFRAVGSISANIAEGYGRGSDKELQRYCIIARGSLDESRDWIYKSLLIGYINKKRADEYDLKFMELRKMLNVFISKVRSRIK